MTLEEYYKSQIPDYYDTMYLEGYTPEQILTASKKRIFNSMEQDEEENYEIVINTGDKKK